MSDIAIRYHVHNKPPKGAELSDAAKKEFTAHKFNRGTRETGCGKQVPEGDLRWHINRDGKDSDINCTRCLHPKAAPGERKTKARAAGKAKPKKAAKKKSASATVQGTPVPKSRMKELRKRAASRSASGAGTPTTPPEPEYDPTAEEDLQPEPSLEEQERMHEPLPRTPYDPIAHE